jgi:hypothetical protein
MNESTGYDVAHLVETLHHKPEDRGFDFQMGSLKCFHPHCSPVIGSASRKNEYKGSSLVGKTAGAYG